MGPKPKKTLMSFRDILGLLKDKAALSAAALRPNPNPSAALLLRATTHSPATPPSDRHLSALLLFGHSARATASPLISALIDRLHRTGNSVVALKCLLIVHHIINRGPFILQDQLSVFPAAGGRNYLKLSSFRDGAAWGLSQWVRWYARYLETSLSVRRVLGYFPSSIKEDQRLRISSSLNSDLIREIDAVAVLIEEILKLPDPAVPDGNLLVKEIIGLVISDYLASVNEILPRVGEVGERLSCLSFSDSLELVCAINRLMNCREKVSAIYMVEKPAIEMMWRSIEEVKEKVQRLKTTYGGGGKLLILGRPGKASESARFDGPVVESVVFHSGRF